jgi:glycosyltransferase involved in cell wall biosynthesis
MRIVFIAPFGMVPKGTAQVRALPLAQALCRRGHQVKLVLPPFHTPAVCGQQWNVGGVEIENIRLSRFPTLGYGISAWRLVRRALAWRPQVIHCFKPKGYSGLALWLLWWWWQPGKRPVRLVLDSDDWEGRGGWNELEPYPGWQKRLFARQEQWGLTHADAVTVASRGLETIVWSLGVRPERVIYMPNGAAVNRPVQADAGSQPIVLLYTRFFEFDVRRVVSVFHQVRQRVPEARLRVVGKGLCGEETQLLACSAAAGLQDSVEYLGWVPQEELPIHFAAARCALVPLNDTLVNRTRCSVKLADLLASGVPVVAEAVGQNQEYIETQRSGLLVPTGDDAAMTEACVRLLTDPHLRATLAAGAQERMETHLGWDRLAECAESAYQIR